MHTSFICYDLVASIHVYRLYKVHLRVDFEALRRHFCPICVQGLSRRCLGGVSNLRVARKEAKGSSKMAASPTNQNCSFDGKWQSQYGCCHFEKPFQLIRVVLLIANSGCHFQGRTVFTVGRRPMFLHDDSEMYLECSPDIVHPLVI